MSNSDDTAKILQDLALESGPTEEENDQVEEENDQVELNDELEVAEKENVTNEDLVLCNLASRVGLKEAKKILGVD